MKVKLLDEFGNDQLDENGQVQYVEDTKEDTLHQCCSCENVFNAGQADDVCPFCNSGNIVEGHIDEPIPLSKDDKEKILNALLLIADYNIDLLSYEGQTLFNQLSDSNPYSIQTKE